MNKKIKRIIPRQRIKYHKGKIRDILRSILTSRLRRGEYIKKFEGEFARYIGTKYAIALPSARIGFYLILEVLNIKKNDEIIISSYNTPIVPNVIIQYGAKPIFVDVNNKTFNINPDQIEENITERTKAIVITHIEGQPCDIDKILYIAHKHDLKVIEDCAHAIGSTYKGQKVGTFGIVSFYSLGMGKQINSLSGGMIVTKNKRIFLEIKRKSSIFNNVRRLPLFKKILKFYLISFLTRPFIFLISIYPILLLSYFLNKDIITNIFEDFGTKKIDLNKIAKFSDLQSAIGLLGLKTIDDDNSKRVKNALLLDSLLKKEIKRQKHLPQTRSIYFNFTILVKNRKEAIKRLLNYGIDTQRTWIRSCSNLKMFKKYKKTCPVSEEISERALYIPIYPSLTRKQIAYIACTLKGLLK